VVLCTIGLSHYVWNNGLRWRFGVLPGLVLLIGLMLFMGSLYSPLPATGLERAGRYLSMNVYIFFATMLFANDLDRLANLMKVIALLGMVTAAVSIVYLAWAGTEGIFRFALPLQNPIWFARGMGISLFATMFMVKQTRSKAERFLYLFFIPPMLFLLYIAASRGPLLAFLIALIFYFFVLQRKRFSLFKKVTVVLLAYILLRLSIAIAPQHIWSRMANLFSGFDITALARLRAFEIAESLFLENPIIGVGTGGFGHFSGLKYPHNIFLEFASELGILGLLAFIVFIIYAAYLGTKLIRNKISSTLKLNLSKTYFTLFVFTLVNSQFSGEVHGNYELWFATAGIWTLYSTRYSVPQIR
jgi:O-antigen ligase